MLGHQTGDPSMSGYQFIGKPVQRGDTAGKVAGRVLYTTDLYRPGMLYGKILYSDRPHARILKIDTGKAELLPGVQVVITAANSPSKHFGIYIRDRSIFAAGEVRCIGEPIAAVAASSSEIAEKAVQAIQVEYEELPAIFDIQTALSPSAPILHPHLAEYESIYPYIRYGNVCMDACLSAGDIEHGFAEADVILEETYHTAPAHHAAIEPHGCVAEVDELGRIIVYTGTQQISVLHNELATALDIPMTDVKVVPVSLGGGFGGRLKTHFEQICALLARQVRRPVKIVLSREEVFTTTPGRAPFTIRMKIGAKRDGTLTAKDVDVLVDAGPYSDHTPGTAAHAITMVQGPYRLANCRARARVVLTDNPDWGCMRGYGAQEIAFATESMMDALAQELRIDPVDLRLKNLAQEGDELITTQKLRCVTIRETMEAAIKASGYREKKGHLGSNRGIGLANIMHITGFLSSSAMVRVNEDATFSILSGITDIGTGSQTVLRQIAAEVLGVPLDAVRIASADSDTAPYDTGSIASRTTFDSGNAVRLAAEDVRKKLANAGAMKLECEPDDVILEGGYAFQRDQPENRISFKDLVGIALYVTAGPLIGSGSWLATSPFEPPVGKGYAQGPAGTFLFGTHVAEVEVDPETGQTRVLRYTACHDVGRAILPNGVTGQIEGGVVQGIGYTLSEEVLLQEGRILNPSFSTYLVPMVGDVPPIQVIYLEYPDPTGPFGAKGIGEPPIMGPAPAIANAIRDATGADVRQIPITGERLFNALKTK
jgi:CO/xanthine dehydrogenase Mo-binding subunit